ncbi:MAG TPA: DUF2946 family protein [Solimonas sp.]
MSLIRLSQLRNSALFGWLLLFVLARGMLAPGFMPTFGAGGLSIQLCTPQGAETVWIGGDVAAQAHGSLECPFGLSLGLAAIPALPAVLVVERTQEAPAPSRFVAPATFIAVVYQARGPPSLS